MPQLKKSQVAEWTSTQILACTESKSLEFQFDTRFNVPLYRVRVGGKVKAEEKSLDKAIEEYNKHP